MPENDHVAVATFWIDLDDRWLDDADRLDRGT